MEFIKRAGDLVSRNYYFANGQEQLYKKILSQPLFEQLIAYLLNQPEPVILRRIKEQFPEAALERVLEEMVKSGVVTRTDRRYQVSFPIFTDEALPALAAQIAELTEKYQETIEQINASAADPNMAFDLLNMLFPKEDAYFFAIESGKLQDLYEERLKRAQIEAGPYIYTTIHTTESDDLVTYFDKLERRESLTAVQAKMYRLIGDVNPKYAFNQISRLLTRSVYKKDIFIDSLIELEIIREKNDEWEIVLGRFPLNEEPRERTAAPIAFAKDTTAERVLLEELTKTAFAKQLPILADSFGRMFLMIRE